jgi:hypothetical protein
MDVCDGAPAFAAALAARLSAPEQSARPVDAASLVDQDDAASVAAWLRA